jgi:hypothetical protein
MEPALGLAVVAVGLGAAVSALWLGWMNGRATHWPSVEGVVTRSALDASPAGFGDMVADFSYAYRVGGRDFECSRVAYASRCPSTAASRRLIARFPVGRRLTVFYDPASPSSAVLERRAEPAAPSLAVLGATIAFAVFLTR